jgi:hypothetical protein
MGSKLKNSEIVLDIGRIGQLVFLHTTSRTVIVHSDCIATLKNRTTKMSDKALRARKMRINRRNKVMP